MENEQGRTEAEVLALMSLVVWIILDLLAAIQIDAIYRDTRLAVWYVLGILYFALLVAIDDWNDYQWRARIRVGAAGVVVVLVKIIIITAQPLIPIESQAAWQVYALLSLLIVVGWAAWVVLTSTPNRS